MVFVDNINNKKWHLTYSLLIGLLPQWHYKTLLKKTKSLFSVIYKLERTGFLCTGTKLNPISQTQTIVLNACWSLNLKRGRSPEKARGRQESGTKGWKKRMNEEKKKTCAGRLECAVPAWGKVQSSGLKLQWACINVHFFLIWLYTYIPLIMSGFTVSMLWCDFKPQHVSLSNCLDYFHSCCGEITPESCCYYFSTFHHVDVIACLR